MSVLVKGMEMPLYATRNGEKDTMYPFANCNEAHIDKYPLIEVQTPHGRLIDADEYGANYIIDFDKSPLEVLESTPTIIEAEVSENA